MIKMSLIFAEVKGKKLQVCGGSLLPYLQGPKNVKIRRPRGPFEMSYFVVLLRILGIALIVRLTTANLTVLFTLLNGSHVKYIFGFTTQQSEYLKSLAKCLTPLSF